MKKELLAILFCSAIVAASCNNASTSANKSETADPNKNENVVASDSTDVSNSDTTQLATVYVCPMHPEVVSNKPDTCPKCGMDLEKKE